MVYKIIYLLFVISISFGGNIHFLGVTPRHIMVVVMAMLCIANLRILKKYCNNFINLYLIFLFFSFVSFTIDGFLNIFLRNLIAQHCVAIVCYFSTCFFYDKFKSFKFLIVSFLLCGIINALVITLQYMHHPVAIFLGSLFVEEESVASRHLELLEQGEGMYCIGLRGDAVHNGFFQMIMPFFLAYFYLSSPQKKHILYKLLCFSLLLILFISVYFIQERSCIILVVIGFVYYIFRYYKKASPSSRFRLFSISIIIGVTLFVFFFSSLQTVLSESRFNADEPNVRVSLFLQWINYIQTHFLFGGMNTFILFYGTPPHNIVLNSFLQAGVIGFLFGIFLYSRQIILSIRLRDLNMSNTILVYAFIVYSLNSLFHNDSILSGDAICWILWALVVCQQSRFNYLIKWKK